jgi:hypothetical protein
MGFVGAIPRGSSLMAIAEGQTHSELKKLYQVERSEGGPCKASARVCPKERRHRPPAAPNARRAGLSAEQIDLGERWNHVVRRGACSEGHHHSTPKS